MVSNVIRGPHSLYRRYQALLESMATAAGFAILISLALKSMAAYPTNWIVVLGVFIFAMGIRWPIVAYVVAVAAMTYPIYTINLYLAVLFIAVSALGHRIFTHFLGATALVLATPLLAEYHLHWLAPILGGLWWGGIAGVWIGAMAAIWGKVMAGMAGMNTDWLILAGQTPEIQAIAERFQDANSLDTLLLLVEPFANTSTLILYNLLQVFGWAAAGGFVGSLSTSKWVKYRAPWSVMVVTAGGALIMLVTHVGLPYWLSDSVSQPVYDPVAPLFSLMVVIVVGTVVYSLRESLDLPVAPKRRYRKVRRQPAQSAAAGGGAFGFFKRASAVMESTQKKNAGKQNFDDNLDKPRRPVRVPNQSELPEWEPPKSDSGLIMLEID